MAISLVKGQTIDLRKNDGGAEYDLSQVTIGLGWDVRKKDTGFFAKLFGAEEEDEYDLEAMWYSSTPWNTHRAISGSPAITARVPARATTSRSL
jgi:stress response protein SCP2